MAEKKINGRQLAQLTGLHETTISRLRNADVMPQMDVETLDALCRCLECRIEDLIEFVVSPR